MASALAMPGVAYAGACESSFTVGGDAASGMTFAAEVTRSKLNVDATILELKAIALNEEVFLIGPVTPRPGGADLRVMQKPTATARGFDVDFSVDGRTGRVGVATRLPPGMLARPADIRTAVCGMLARLGRVRPEDLARAAAIKPAPSPPVTRTSPPSARTAPPSADSRTAPPQRTLNLLQPRATFNLAAAKAAIEPGTGLITGTACVKRFVDNGGGLFLASNQDVYLYPVTPYLEEWLKLSKKAKPGRDQLDANPDFLATRLQGRTNDEGQFRFAQMKPGRYYLVTQLDTTAHGSRNVMLGSAQTGQREITQYYTTQPISATFQDVLEKIVEVRKEGDEVKLSLSPPLNWKVLIGQNNGSAGLLGCRM